MYYKRNKNAEQISTTANNGSYTMRVSEVFEQQFLYRSFTRGIQTRLTIPHGA